MADDKKVARDANRARVSRARGALVIGSARDRLKVSIASDLITRIRANPAGLERLIQGYYAGVAEVQDSGVEGSFAVHIDVSGYPSFAPLEDYGKSDSSSAERDEEADLPAALDTARDRGRTFAASLSASSDMLSAADLAKRLGVSRMTINARRQRHELLGLEGAKRGFRFPSWQVDERGRAFPEIKELFEILGEDPWVVYRFLVQRHSIFGGEIAHIVLARGGGDDVVGAARSYAEGSFA